MIDFIAKFNPRKASFENILIYQIKRLTKITYERIMNEIFISASIHETKDVEL